MLSNIYKIMKQLEEKIGDGCVVSFRSGLQSLQIRVDWEDDIHFQIRFTDIEMDKIVDENFLIERIINEAKKGRARELGRG